MILTWNWYNLACYGVTRAKDDPNMNCFPYVEENYEAIEEELGPGPIRQVTIQVQKEKK